MTKPVSIGTAEFFEMLGHLVADIRAGKWRP